MFKVCQASGKFHFLSIVFSNLISSKPQLAEISKYLWCQPKWQVNGRNYSQVALSNLTWSHASKGLPSLSQLFIHFFISFIYCCDYKIKIGYIHWKKNWPIIPLFSFSHLTFWYISLLLCILLLNIMEAF